eukprot:5431768-Pyramimonas_sp.AAC.1
MGKSLNYPPRRWRNRPPRSGEAGDVARRLARGETARERRLEVRQTLRDDGVATPAQSARASSRSQWRSDAHQV